MKIKFANNLEAEIYCPTCTPPRKLVVKTNRQNDNQFLGCPNWPECDHTQRIPESWYMKALGQPELF